MQTLSWRSLAACKISVFNNESQHESIPTHTAVLARNVQFKFRA
jgi:hypothetical protein